MIIHGTTDETINANFRNLAGAIVALQASAGGGGGGASAAVIDKTLTTITNTTGWQRLRRITLIVDPARVYRIYAAGDANGSSSQSLTPTFGVELDGVNISAKAAMNTSVSNPFFRFEYWVFVSLDAGGGLRVSGQMIQCLVAPSETATAQTSQPVMFSTLVPAVAPASSHNVDLTFQWSLADPTSAARLRYTIVETL
jgi:hypothetical protein